MTCGGRADRPSEVCFSGTSMPSKRLIHLRMCHVGDQTMVKAKNHGKVVGLDWNCGDDVGFCSACPAGKAKVRHHAAGTGPDCSAYSRGEYWCTDLYGPTRSASFGGARYSHVFVDVTSRIIKGNNMIRKSNATAATRGFIRGLPIGRDQSIRVKYLKSDNDPSNLDTNEFRAMLVNEGVQRRPQTPYDHVKIAERTIGVLSAMTLCILS